MNVPVIIFTKTDRSSLFDNLATLHRVDQRDRRFIIADYSEPQHFERTRFLVRSQPQYRERKDRTSQIQFLRIQKDEGMALLKVLISSSTQRFISFKNYAHFHKALQQSPFLATRNQDLQPTYEYFDRLPFASDIFPSAIVMTLEVFWRALNYQSVDKENMDRPTRSLHAS